MRAPAPVRYRCEIHSSLELDDRSTAARPRVLELSEVGAFLEAAAGLEDTQEGDGALLGIPLPGGAPWVAHVRFGAARRGRLDFKTPHADHVSVSVRGFEVYFDGVHDDELERLRDFLELLDHR